MIAFRKDFDQRFSQDIHDMFGEGSALSSAKNFRVPARTTANGERRWPVPWKRTHHLVVEAGTGVGKSLAYLMPAALFALEHHRKAIISTHTINLQEQLLQKDIPIVRQLLDRPFEAALLKGRQNYLCPNRLERALQLQNDLFNSSEQQELLRIKDWSQRTTEGTLSDLDVEPDPSVWAQVCSEPHICTPKTCGDR